MFIDHLAQRCTNEWRVPETDLYYGTKTHMHFPCYYSEKLQAYYLHCRQQEPSQFGSIFNFTETLPAATV